MLRPNNLPREGNSADNQEWLVQPIYAGVDK
jgi:hypothetical protein